MSYRIRLRKTLTGEERTTPIYPYVFHLFWWDEGNMGCDCNRQAEWHRAAPDYNKAEWGDDYEHPVHGALFGECGHSQYQALYAILEDGTTVPIDSNPHKGSSVDDFLQEEGLLAEETAAAALKQISMIQKPLTVVYHSADYDGIFCREIAKAFLPGATTIGWDFGQQTIPFPPSGEVYLLDLPPDCFVEETLDPSRLIWVDHHASSISKWEKKLSTHTGILLSGVAACRLAWQWFSGRNPPKLDYQERLVIEPTAVCLAGEYDVWEHGNSGEDDITFQFGLDTETNLNWALMFDNDRDYVNKLIEQGRFARACIVKREADIAKSRSFDLDFEGLKFLSLTTARCTSLSFQAAIRPEHDGCMGAYWDGRMWNISLYGVPGKPEIDLSKIAVKYGGGGHKQACGFRVATFPPLPSISLLDSLSGKCFIGT